MLSVLLRIEIRLNGVVLVRLDGNNFVLLLVFIGQLDEFRQVGNNFDLLFLLAFFPWHPGWGITP